MKSLLLRAFCLGLAVALCALPVIALADTAADLAKAKKERAEIQRRLDRTVADYHAAEARLATTQHEIAETQARLTEAENRLQRAQLALGKRANALYRAGPTSVIQVLIASDGLSDFLRRLQLLERASNSDSAVMIGAQRARAEMNDLKADLEARRNQEQQTAARLRGLAGDLGRLFKDAAAKESILLTERDAQIRRRQEAEARARRAAIVARTGSFNPGSFVCPVDGPNSFSDSWGDPRPGGRRHEGVDLFAARGTPVVAVVDGAVKRHSSSAGGISMYLRGNDGSEYFYAHLNGYSDVPNGQRVPAGTVVAYVGNSGNARGAAPHLHFEIHPGGGRAINPYPTVRAACR
jgi:murein DD-endopeptidase MepM/ murein hydrolase activator NlpD